MLKIAGGRLANLLPRQNSMASSIFMRNLIHCDNGSDNSRSFTTSSSHFSPQWPSFGVSKGNTVDDNSSESIDDFERWMSGGLSEGESNKNSILKNLERVDKARTKSTMGWHFNGDNGSDFVDGLRETYDTLQDGLDVKLKKAATSFNYDEMYEDNYKYRPDVTFFPDTTYDIKDLDLTKPVVQKSPPKYSFRTTTKEVLDKADFRNVRFLANFITEAGIIIKRSKTGISAKAQRKLAREIKTARAFGLLPFISMGTKSFMPGRSMKEDDLTLQFDSKEGFSMPWRSRENML